MLRIIRFSRRQIFDVWRQDRYFLALILLEYYPDGTDIKGHISSGSFTA